MPDNTSNSTSLTDAITALDDAAALRVLSLATGPGLRNDPLEWSPDLASALRDHFAPPAADSPAPPADLARTALLALAADPQHTGPLRALIAGPPPQRFALDPVSGTLLITAALFALQSHIEIERDSEGRWTFKFKKEPTKDSLIAPLIKKLAALISGSPPPP